MLASLLALLLHLDTDLRYLARLDLDLPRLLAERLVPDLDRLLARGQAIDRGLARDARQADEGGRGQGGPGSEGRYRDEEVGPGGSRACSTGGSRRTSRRTVRRSTGCFTSSTMSPARRSSSCSSRCWCSS